MFSYFNIIHCPHKIYKLKRSGFCRKGVKYDYFNN